jgi:hypothetical protein
MGMARRVSSLIPVNAWRLWARFDALIGSTTVGHRNSGFSVRALPNHGKAINARRVAALEQ